MAKRREKSTDAKQLKPSAFTSAEKAIVPKETKNADSINRPAQQEFQNQQLSLFQSFLANNDEKRDTLSNAIDLWDSVPRYSISRQAMTKARIQDRFLEKHELTFQHRGQSYTRVVYPARVKDFDGVDREFYPSANEELIEDALRKLAIEQQAGYFDRPNYSSGVVFSLYMLRDELQKRGHTRSYPQIVQSLNILAHSIVDIIPHGEGEKQITSPCLPALAAVSRARLAEDPKARWVVQFHPLVTGGIDTVQYRQFNYHVMMSHSTQLARWLHKQLVLKFTFADHFKTFETRYSTVKRDSGMLEGYKRERDAVDALEAAYLELQQREVISRFERKDELGPRKKLIDVVFTVRPNSDFVHETKAANRRQLDGRKSVEIGRGSK
jgi:hypothetical protein